MIDALKRLMARIRPAPAPAIIETPAPAQVVEPEDDPAFAYTPELAETLIDGLCDQLEATQAKVRSLTSELVKANVAITQLAKLPKNRYYGKGK